MKIGNKKIGDGCFVVAEAGVNHLGDLGIAKEMVDWASRCGADAIKFQVHIPKSEIVGVEGSPFDYSSLLSEANCVELKRFADEQGIVFFSSVFCNKAVDLLELVGVSVYKIGSGEMTNFPLLDYIMDTGKPMIISTGMSTMDEIEETVDFLKGYDFALLHCVSMYPPAHKDLNLGLIPVLKERFGVPVGFSDHTSDIYTPVVAVALGADIIEKHFTLSKQLPGPDQDLSIDVDELGKMVANVACIQDALGNEKIVTKKEKELQRWARESAVAKFDIPKGTEITVDMLCFKRPGWGIPAKPTEIALIIGKTAKRDIPKDTILGWDDFER